MTDTVGQLHAKASAQDQESNDRRLNRRRTRGLLAGIILAVLVYLIFPSNAADLVNGAYPDHDNGPFNQSGMRMTAAVAVLMGAWWMTEAIPLAATALVPLVVFPSHRSWGSVTFQAPMRNQPSSCSWADSSWRSACNAGTCTAA